MSSIDAATEAGLEGMPNRGEAARKIARKVVVALAADGWLRTSPLQHGALDGDDGKPSLLATLRAALRQAVGILPQHDDVTAEWALLLERTLWEEGLLLLPMPKGLDRVIPQDVRLHRPANGCLLVLTLDPEVYGDITGDTYDELAEDLRRLTTAWGARGYAMLDAGQTLAAMDDDDLALLGLARTAGDTPETPTGHEDVPPSGS